MTNLWLLNVGLPLMVLGVRLIIIYRSLVRARRAGHESTPALQIPWSEGITFTTVGVIVLAVGLIYYLSFSHPEWWPIANAGALVASLGIGQLIQACAQRYQGPKRLKRECIIRIGALVATSIGAAFTIAYAFI